jgi:hypothetical protein
LKLLRPVSAVVAGITVAVILYYIALIVFVLVTLGIPLGSQPRALTPLDNVVLLTLAVVAAAVGGRAASRLNPSGRVASVGAVCVALALGAIWGFYGSVGWPPWWGAAMALAMSAGAWYGGTWQSG